MFFEEKFLRNRILFCGDFTETVAVLHETNCVHIVIVEKKLIRIDEEYFLIIRTINLDYFPLPIKF